MLYFRTVLQKDLKYVIPNKYGVKRMLKAAKKTTVEDPFMDLGKHQWSYNNHLVNEISQQFSEGFFAKSMGLKTVSQKYVFAYTCEKNPETKQ